MLSYSRSTILSISKRSYRLNSTLAFVESSANSSISPSSLSALTAAVQIGKPITAILTGSKASDTAKELTKIPQIEKILISKSSKYDHNLPEEISPLLVEILQKNKETYTNFVVPASSVSKNFLPRVGALLDLQPISDIIQVVSKDTFVRPTYAGNAWLTVRSKDSQILTSVRSSAFPPIELATESNSSIPIEEVEYVESNAAIEWKSEELITSERPDLGSAKVVVSGGRGLKNKEEFDKVLNPLAEKLNAAIGASRAAVDSGFCDNSLQVGQTGKVVAPDLYIAVGISGAIQHLAGMKDSKVIVAINKDEEAPIFGVSDIGLVGDVFEIVPELTSKLIISDMPYDKSKDTKEQAWVANKYNHSLALSAMTGLIASFPVAKVFASNAVPLLMWREERQQKAAAATKV
ncbi:hypothetical protein CANARDRAFT_7550 [[Candida] arabinofermentans NRRL YB-2248]|uniref:Probable electron transfer flavoprotein subunit alpha, mitochondrial n=1 Tax=[Candida] arabinofermentans NRRL YB-2248 TaxID=983967 RepID=A0A1E4T0Z2_9ASCO|nr:hypothetical protein CANARDRAFT_7550 [[Candida] arabinofermentans NRRL YB-2248]